MKFREAINKSGGIKEFFVPIIFGCWLLYQFINSFSLKQSNFDSLGSDGYARIVSGSGLILISVYLIKHIITLFQIWKGVKPISENILKDPDDAAVLAKGNNGSRSQISQNKSSKSSNEFLRYFITLARTHYELSMMIMCILYVFLIGQIGFVIPSMLYLFITMMMYSTKEKRSFIAILFLAIIFSVGVYFVFRYGFKIILP